LELENLTKIAVNKLNPVPFSKKVYSQSPCCIDNPVTLTKRNKTFTCADTDLVTSRKEQANFLVAQGLILCQYFFLSSLSHYKSQVELLGYHI